MRVLYQDLGEGGWRKARFVAAGGGRAYNLRGVQVAPADSQNKLLGCQHPINWNEVNYHEEGRIQRLSNRNQ